MQPGIGSVLPAAGRGGAGILDTWLEDRPWRAFRTARAALSTVLKLRRSRRVWLPVYICRSVAEGVQSSGAEIAWYGTDTMLCPDTQDLAQAEDGEAVLCVSYFGRGANDRLRRLAAQRPGLTWIEDRAQAMDTGQPAFGDILLYSPRKLFGVGDGGIVASHGALPEATLSSDDADWQANIARARDPDGLAPGTWFDAFRTREAAMDSAPRAMSGRTLATLSQLDWKPEADTRRRNWACLAERLSHIALWPEHDVDFVPLAYPIVTDDAGLLSAGLAAERIWCARHWADLPSPETFVEAHTLSRRCLSLPIDGRYGANDMARIADAVVSILGKPEKTRSAYSG